MTLHLRKVKERLLELGFSPEEADEVAERLLRLSGQTRQALESWMATGEIDTTLDIKGYTIPRLMKEFGMTFPAALLTLEWIIRSPEEAISALEEGMDILL